MTLPGGLGGRPPVALSMPWWRREGRPLNRNERPLNENARPLNGNERPLDRNARPLNGNARPLDREVAPPGGRCQHGAMFREATVEDLPALLDLERRANLAGLAHVFPP